MRILSYVAYGPLMVRVPTPSEQQTGRLVFDMVRGFMTRNEERSFPLAVYKYIINLKLGGLIDYQKPSHQTYTRLLSTS